MLIVCMTMRAAADVLFILLGVGLRPGGAFRMTGPVPPGTPVHFTLSAAPPAHLVEQLRAIPDTTIVEKEAT